MEMERVVSLGRNTHLHGAAHLGVKALLHFSVKALSHLGVKALFLAYWAGGVPERSPTLLPVTFTHRVANTGRDKFACTALPMAKKDPKSAFDVAHWV